MTEPRRLVEQGTEFERGVLRSARLDSPSDDGLKRTLLAIGAGAPTLSASASTAGAGGAAAGKAGAAGKGLTLLGGVGAGALVKWVGVAVAVACAGSALTNASLARRRSVPAHLPVSAPAAMLSPSEAPPPNRAPGATGAGSQSPSSEGSDLEPRPKATGTASDRVTHVASQRSAREELSAASSVEPRPASLLQAEVAALDRVRASLAERNAARALQELDAYERAFPNSDFAEEGTVLRIDALVDSGDVAAARVLARRFLLTNPATPHAAHLSQLLDAHNLRSLSAPRGI